MGTELSTATKPGLIVNRHIVGYAAGTSKLHSIEIIRNGEVLQTFHPTTYWFDFVYDDMVSMNTIALKSPDKRPPFIYYYLKVTQEDGHIAWSSPIWVDLLPPSKDLKRPTPTRGGAVKERVILEELDDEDDEDDDPFVDE